MGLLYERETYAIRGAVFEVYKELGNGFLEAVYQECLATEFESENITYLAQPELQLTYKGKSLLQKYKPDFLCFEKIILELKVVRQLAPEHEAQILNYLKITGLKVGLLINFGGASQVEIKRFAL